MFPFSVKRDRLANEIQVEKGKEYQMNTSWLQQPTFQQFPQNRILIETTSQRRPHLLVEETEIAVHHFAMHLFCVFENGGEKVSFCKVTVAQNVSNFKKHLGVDHR